MLFGLFGSLYNGWKLGGFEPRAAVDKRHPDISTSLDNLNVDEEKRIECKAGCVIITSLIERDIIDVLKQKIATRAANVERNRSA